MKFLNSDDNGFIAMDLINHEISCNFWGHIANIGGKNQLQVYKIHFLLSYFLIKEITIILWGYLSYFLILGDIFVYFKNRIWDDYINWTSLKEEKNIYFNNKFCYFRNQLNIWA